MAIGHTSFPAKVRAAAGYFAWGCFRYFGRARLRRTGGYQPSRRSVCTVISAGQFSRTGARLVPAPVDV
ncbi:hypothetical protein SAMN05444164_5743 [Bradyrhizobium erythrophlei]|uniref:Uncharacterized protein n=1 Tax=Bradyrhizobium erythrophlei TaxID=1437360 RepID=A0A1H5DDP2_9BRAD|nr:hypothetical protein SAMN05444164_5743 [Bradyrhizobium erythrophlei]